MVQRAMYEKGCIEFLAICFAVKGNQVTFTAWIHGWASLDTELQSVPWRAGGCHPSREHPSRERESCPVATLFLRRQWIRRDPSPRPAIPGLICCAVFP